MNCNSIIFLYDSAMRAFFFSLLSGILQIEILFFKRNWVLIFQLNYSILLFNTMELLLYENPICLMGFEFASLIKQSWLIIIYGSKPRTMNIWAAHLINALEKRIYGTRVCGEHDVIMNFLNSTKNSIIFIMMKMLTVSCSMD